MLYAVSCTILRRPSVGWGMVLIMPGSGFDPCTGHSLRSWTWHPCGPLLTQNILSFSRFLYQEWDLESDIPNLIFIFLSSSSFQNLNTLRIWALASRWYSAASGQLSDQGYSLVFRQWASKMHVWLITSNAENFSAISEWIARPF